MDLVRRLRSRSALVQAVAAPLALSVVFGALISGATVGDTTIAIVADDGPVTQAIASSFAMAGEAGEVASDADDDADSVRFVAVDAPEAASALPAFADEIVDGDGVPVDGEVVPASAAIVLTTTTAAAGPLAIEVVRTPQAPVAGQIAEAVAVEIARQAETGGQPPVDLVQLPAGGRALSALPYYGASMSILLGFFSISLIARSLLEERGNRTLDRLASSSAPLSAIAAGKAVSLAAVTAGGFVVVWLTTWLVFGGDWGDPVSVLVMILASVLAIGGIGVLTGSFARTPRQADTYAAVVAFLLAILGGSFVPPADTPAALRVVRGFNPIGWALDGFTALSVDVAGVGDVARSIALLTAAGVIAGGIGLVRLSRPEALR